MVKANSDRSVQPELVARLCVEYWKLVKTSLRLIDQLPEREGKRLAAQVKFSNLQLSTISEQMGISVISFDGEILTAGMPASVDNSEDYNENGTLFVTKTIEPAIVWDMKVIQKGRVIVGRCIEKFQEE